MFETHIVDTETSNARIIAQLEVSSFERLENFDVCIAYLKL